MLDENFLKMKDRALELLALMEKNQKAVNLYSLTESYKQLVRAAKNGHICPLVKYDPFIIMIYPFSLRYWYKNSNK